MPVAMPSSVRHGNCVHKRLSIIVKSESFEPQEQPSERATVILTVPIAGFALHQPLIADVRFVDDRPAHGCPGRGAIHAEHHWAEPPLQEFVMCSRAWLHTRWRSDRHGVLRRALTNRKNLRLWKVVEFP